eukprot:TRINITY_DN5476_c0_g1_i2.p1 TRINITY_DN5476_c0_g1~~TRINITY_DN5476_c0_g1_i2.p1  ORF type:complete len:201 (-),score=38.64 TRINITY_DN5476_c0_g1_i2:217-819(-)
MDLRRKYSSNEVQLKRILSSCDNLLSEGFDIPYSFDTFVNYLNTANSLREKIRRDSDIAPNKRSMKDYERKLATFEQIVKNHNNILTSQSNRNKKSVSHPSYWILKETEKENLSNSNKNMKSQEEDLSKTSFISKQQKRIVSPNSEKKYKNLTAEEVLLQNEKQRAEATHEIHRFTLRIKETHKLVNNIIRKDLEVRDEL